VYAPWWRLGCWLVNRVRIVWSAIHPTIQVPPTVQAFWQPVSIGYPGRKTTFTNAAVIGTEGPLLAAPGHWPRCRRPPASGLTHLQAAEFLYETHLFPERVYTFKHALTHDVAYSSLLTKGGGRCMHVL